jgi:hypothetical protein
MRKVIIGIHGLGNKPPKKILKTWWEKCIKEGLNYISGSGSYFKFELVYWADLLHEIPLDIKMRDRENPLYLEDPYTPRAADFVVEKPKESKKEFLDKVEKKMEALFFKEESLINFDKIADFVIKNFFKDLAVYYQNDSTKEEKSFSEIKGKIRNRLAVALDKYKKYDIFLIAHSMGSIVAYDVLTQKNPDLKINTFITIGSPLGLPVIIKKILKEQNIDFTKDHCPQAPESIKNNWYNFSDLDDKIAINYTLADDFKKNTNGIGPVDFIVDNDYEYKGHQNPHKSYGYLRTQEVAKVIQEFLQSEEGGFWHFLKSKLFAIQTLLPNKIRSINKK